MALIYVDGHLEGTIDTEVVSEEIYPGDLVVRESGGGAHVADASSDSRVDGIALSLEAGDNIASHPYDYRPTREDFSYRPASQKDSDDKLPNTDDRVPLSVALTGRPIPKTIKDNGTDPAPNITQNDVVGVAAVGANEQDEIQGRIVEEGYTDNGGTTYGRSSTGDFVALGRAEEDVSSFDEMVRVRREDARL